MEKRQCLRSWLENIMDTGQITGLTWLDKVNEVFRIPWKHISKPDFVLESDAQVYIAWAHYRGRYEDGEQPDLSTCKSRFRCALNKLAVEIKHLSCLDSDQPYKVFKFLQKGEAKKTVVFPETKSPNIPLLGTNSDDVGFDGVNNMTSNGDCYVGDNMVDNVDFLQDNMLKEFDMNEDFSDGNEPYNMVQQQAYNPTTVDPLAQFPDNGLQSTAMNPEAMAVNINIYYRGQKVAERTVTNKFGCRIHSGIETTSLIEYHELHGPCEADQIRLPDEQGLEDMLDNLSRGLLLQWETNNIWAIRLCQAHVYASGGCLGSSIVTMERKKQLKVFDCEQFLVSLAEYHVNRATVPSYEIFFVFGQQPASGTTVDPGVKVTVSVTHCLAKACISRVGSARDVTTSIEDNEDKLVRSFQALNLQQCLQPPRQ